MSEAASRPRNPVGSAVWWSFTWALGAAVGVALGGWLTLVGGAGAPGASGVDPLSDLVVLPGAVFVAMLVGQIAVRLSVRAIRRRASESGNDENDH